MKNRLNTRVPDKVCVILWIKNLTTKGPEKVWDILWIKNLALQYCALVFDDFSPYYSWKYSKSKDLIMK